MFAAIPTEFDPLLAEHGIETIKEGAFSSLKDGSLKDPPSVTVLPASDQASIMTPARSVSDDQNDPVCIVGMGGVQSPSDLWDMLLQQKSGQCKVPKTRFNIDGFYHPEGDRAGVMNTMGGYFLQEDVRQFDNSFFGINNLEATYMDPQQRKLLEVVYECFENSGMPLEKVNGSNVGVYVGNFTVDYQTMQVRDAEYLHRYSATGSGTAILANRISHVFDLKGPTFTLDTACSSSIYCLHNAVNALENGECDSAIVAGANLVTAPEQHLGTMKGGVLSATSTCHTFDISADGYGRGEGVSALFLKPLSSAIRDGDNIHAVVRATAINSNGKTPGISQPSVAGQAEVIRKTYQRAGLDINDTTYAECHGTGTALGDPMEVEALSRVFSRRDGSPLLIGAVKTNLGHSEAASGISAVIKAALAFEHKMIPATIGINKVNPKIPLDQYNMKIVTTATPWPTPLHRASISSFGYGGANAHAILESIDNVLPGYRESRLEKKAKDSARKYVLPFSASSVQALESRISTIQERLNAGKEYDLDDLSYTLGNRRSRLSEKGYLITSPATIKADFSPENLVTSKQAAPSHPFCFVFTGQGAQWPQMGKELLTKYPEYLKTIRYLDSVLKNLPEAPSWTLEGAILEPASTSRVSEVFQSQPLCTAVQIGMIELIRSWGPLPDVVVGHSSGEIAAAYAAGLLTAAQAIIIAYYRGYVVGNATSKGAMMAAGVNAETASEIIQENGLGDQVVVACVNSPESVTISGASAGIDKILAELQARKLFARKLQTGGRAYHSHMMQEIGSEYERLMTLGLRGSSGPSDFSDKTVKMFSSVGKHGEELKCFTRESTSYLKPAYWRSNLENPVQFQGALSSIIASGKYHLVEIGPHSALQLPIKQIRTSLGVTEQDLLYSSTLVRGKDAETCLKSLAGQMYLHGHALDFSYVNAAEGSIDGPSKNLVHDLPPYPWKYGQLLWNEPRSSVELRNREYIRHELLGSKTLAGNGIELSWRNILKLKEIPWLEHHKLENTIVFPATGYLTMAMEAVSQIKNLRDQDNVRPTFTFRNVNIQAALVVTPDDNDSELFTTMHSEKISALSTSDTWYDFSISSWQAGNSVQHCTGSISLALTADDSQGGVSVDAADYDKWTMRRWYEKLAEGGLCFGSQFQSLTSMKTDKARVKPEALSTTTLLQRVKRTETSTFAGTFYAVHPLAIDSCLQAAIMGGTAGNLDTLKAFLPVSIKHCRIVTPAPSAVGSEAYIHSQSQTTGPGTKKINVTLRDHSNKVVVDISDARLALYNGKTEDEADADNDRHPCLRVVWKPDVARIDETSQPQLEKYLEQFLLTHPDLTDSKSVGVTAGLIDLLGHKNPRIRVLEVGRDCDCKSRQWLDVLDNGSAFTRYRDWQIGTISAESQLTVSRINAPEKTETKSLDEGFSDTYDVVLLSNKAAAEEYWGTAPKSLMKLLNTQGIVLGKSSSLGDKVLRENGFTIVHLPAGVFFARAPQKARSLKDREVIMLESSGRSSELAQTLSQHFAAIPGVSGTKSYTLSDLAKVEISDKAIVISLLEVDGPFLPVMDPEEMDLLRCVTNKVTDLVWLTGAATLDGTRPDLSLASGLSRALMLEQPALRFATLDIGNSTKDLSSADCESVCEQVDRVLFKSDEPDDKEFVQSNGLLHISRFVPDNGLNSHFTQRRQQTPGLMTLEEASPAKLAIKKIGMMDTIYFQQEREITSPIPAGFVEIDVKAVSLNAKDIYVLSGKVETRTGTSALEFSGIVKGVASDVSEFQAGDRVVVLAPNSFRTTERVPAWACQKMLPEEKFEEMPTLPVIYGTALYALEDRAHLRKGESILIHSGAGAFGMASIAIALRMGATVYTTVSTEEKKDFLVKEFGLPRENMFQSRDTSFVDGVHAATNGKGVDVVLNSLTGDLLHASWRCCANFGRFVEVGKRDIVDAGKLGMEMFSRNVTFTAFDLTELYYHEDAFYRNIWTSKFKEALDLYRAGEIRAVPISTFDVSEITQAYRHFSKSSRVGKVVISLENPKSIVRAVPSEYAATFDPEKSYILIGCLGGLGRSLSKWMLKRGARNFTFLGRSGCDKPSARELVENLEKAGATVQVVRGDVVNKEDVVASVAASPLPIGGVVQAAMGLHEALFTNMTNKAWHTGIQPKWRGTWNIHEALEGKDDQLDFFLLTSSVSGSVGTATESNYCSANGFLDAFSRYRQSLGKPICSLGLGMISEVGYLHENPEIEALLLRKGIQPLNEDEFLQVIDLALAGNPAADGMRYDKLASSHILTGLEPHGIRKLLQQGFDVNNGTMQDARTVLLAASLDVDESSEGGVSGQVATTSWSKDFPAALAKAFASEAAAATLNEAILGLVRKRFSNLILMPLDKVDNAKPLAQYGMDSMIAAEFRSWFWSTFKVDIQFLDILSPTNSLSMLSDLVETKLQESLADAA
ncbi:MAG: Type I Iterative PKS [Peltula sp. TS41687]|nr:MAG: Type I Iterative PKS [Peltula sp. TS41687]